MTTWEFHYNISTLAAIEVEVLLPFLYSLLVMVLCCSLELSFCFCLLTFCKSLPTLVVFAKL
jgi:hypothetical protein